MKIKHYITGALAPALVLGIVPSILAIAWGSFGLLVFGIFFTMSAAGDFMVVDLIKNENNDDYVQDHPSEVGCFVYREEG